MPPPLVETDPFQRPFMDPYGEFRLETKFCLKISMVNLSNRKSKNC